MAKRKIQKDIRYIGVYSGIRATRSLVLCVCFIDRCLSFCIFLLAIVLSAPLRYTDSDYTYGILKLFLLFPVIWIFTNNVSRRSCSIINPEKTIDLSHENNKLYQTMCASQVLMEIMGIRTHSLSQVNRITIRLINNVLEEWTVESRIS
jgi:hypothetical protein